MQTGEFLSRYTVDEVWSSPLVRARETATDLVRFLPGPVRVLEGLREMDVGDLEGMDPHQAWGLYATVVREWLSGNSEFRFPGGESRRELVDRFRESLRVLTSGKTGQTIVVVAHAGLFTHGIAELCRITDQRAFLGLENHNGSISTVDVLPMAVTEVRPGAGSTLEVQLVEWASVGHLRGEAAQVTESVPERFRAKNL